MALFIDGSYAKREIGMKEKGEIKMFKARG